MIERFVKFLNIVQVGFAAAVEDDEVSEGGVGNSAEDAFSRLDGRATSSSQLAFSPRRGWADASGSLGGLVNSRANS